MKNDSQIIDEVVALCQCLLPEIGRVVAHPSYPLTCELVEYDGDEAVVELDGVTRRFPAAEIFDVDHARALAKLIQVDEALKSIAVHADN